MKKTVFFYPLLILFVLCQCKDENEGTEKIDRCDCFPMAQDSYEYPNVKDLGIIELYEKLQIPASVLSKMSTYALTQSVLESPVLRITMGTSSNSNRITNSQKAFANMNGVQELRERKDLENLISYYREIDANCLNSKDVGLYSLDFSYFELLFTDSEILAGFTHAQRKEVAGLVLEKSASALPLAYIMYADGYEPFVDLYNRDADFKQAYSSDFFDDAQKNKIVQLAGEFVRK